MALKTHIREIAEHYTAGRSPGADVKSGLRQASKALQAKIEKGLFTANEMHFGQLFESFCNYKGSDLRERHGVQAADSETCYDIDVVNAITASEFPFITGKLIHNTLIPVYEENLGDITSLVREEDSDRKTVDIAGTMGPEEPEKLLEGQEYQLTTDREKTIQILTHKFGRRIAITRELITFDKSGGSILARARNVGEQMARHRASWIIDGVQDLAVAATGQAVNTIFKYDGSTAALYSTDHSAIDGQTNDNSVTPALSTTGLVTARRKLRAMTDFYGKSLRLEGSMLLVSEEDWGEALRLVSSIGDPDTANRGINVFQGRLTKVISDPEITANNWFYGNFPKQFVWVWIWRPGVQPIVGDAARDIMVSFKYGYYAGFGASDYRLVIKSDGTT